MRLIRLEEWIKTKEKSHKANQLCVCFNCKQCNAEVIKMPSYLKKKNLDRLFCSLSCSTTYRNLVDGTPSQKPGWGEHWRRISVENGTLPVGIKNPRYGAKLTKETKELISKNKSEPTRSHAKFVDYVDSNGNTLRLQGSWEVAVAKWLDSKNIEYIAHPSIKFPYEDSSGQIRHYNPDFYVPIWNCYLDPKNSFCFKQDMYKIKAVRETHKINLIIMTKPVLELYGIRVIGT